MNKIILNLAPTGMIPTKKTSKYVPLTEKEIIQDVLLAYEKGITMVHLHARDSAGVPTHKKDIYKNIIKGIRQSASDLIIVASCSGRHISDFERRSEVLELTGEAKLDMASLTLGSLNFSSSVSNNSPEIIIKLAEKMQSKGIA